MNFFKIFPIIILLLSLGVTTPMLSQVKGGRKKEHRNQRGRGFKLFGNKSRGNANAFAKGHHSKGFIARVFNGNKNGSTWVYRKTNPGKKQNRFFLGVLGHGKFHFSYLN